jgi:hypothetical protein
VGKTLDHFSLFGPTGNAEVSRRLQDQLRLLERVLLTEVPQELKESDIPWQVELTHTLKHPQVRLAQRTHTLGPMLMHLAMRILLVGMVDVFMLIAFQRPIPAG